MKKNQKILITLFAVMCIIPFQFASANNDDTSPSPKNTRVGMENKIKIKVIKDDGRNIASSTLKMLRLQEAKARLASTTQARIERQNKQAKELFTKQSEKITTNYKRAIDRLSDIVDRIQSRIDKLTIQGLDMTATTTDLTVAKANILAAEKALTDLKTYIDSQTVTAKNRQEILQAIRVKGETVKNEIKNAQTSLIKILAALKVEIIKNNTATSTATSTATTTN